MRFGDWGHAALVDGRVGLWCRACPVDIYGGKKSKHGRFLGWHESPEIARRVWREHETNSWHQGAVSREIERSRDALRTALPVLDAIDKWADP